jgi:hypothetical protein
MENDMTDYNAVVDGYLAIWNEADAESRAKLMSQAMTADVSYVDPMAAADSPDVLDATIGAIQQQFADWTFRLVGPVDGHHNLVRFTWELGPEGVDAPIVGFDVAVLSDEDKIQSVHGFLDKVPTS